MKKVTSILATTTLAFTSSAFAGVQLDRMIVYFDADKPPRQDILVTNPDNENLYLETEIFKVENPGAPNEERVRITDPDKMQLLATPGKSIVAPGGRRTVRLISLNPAPKVEEVYRVTFRPVVGELEATQTAVKVLVAYQVLAFIRPENPFYDVSAKSKGTEMTFSNSGNMNVVLRNGLYCPKGVSQRASHATKEEQCVKLEDGSRIYAGQSWTLTLPDKYQNKGGFVEYGLFDGMNEETSQFPL
ncbi:fimbrial biogenesis chaperone [Sansalvadorimonas verongulae]|uniref:fimbrial biogenesis chaperone n=1 Tax=Sansalvadorimonas verongulae TaxID=2172824 RepID=UPI0012BD3EF5|nr:fimbria/pilus periplasmic chaperone [Sansalvadorimonas verongulae]MTI11826.1 molecular chaperone [Sansalvadorimonas verongulae]